MTRGLYPPESLSEEDVRTLRVVRRDIYTNGIVGGGLGACAGVVMYTGAQWAKKFGFLPNTKLNKNHGMMMVLGSFALGTFLAASKSGKEEVHVLHPIFRVGAVDAGGTNAVRDRDIMMMDQRQTYEGRRQALMDNRMTRRRTLDNLLKKHHGLSDSHAGRWVIEEEEQQEELQDNDTTKFEKE
ncbi:hypothetical protein IV203_037136 [Nitzschia inconspicua]|uniref:HIG1 domain-containing protein n=1 Tax=Nitzschia inconspicua TaxID=303405 RepID=A0A9K3LK67_9STRA|nr:hypothetical protein IV203_037136 [Nitzschia inconspicua]